MKLFERKERSRAPQADPDPAPLSAIRCDWRVLVGKDRRPMGVRLALSDAGDEGTPASGTPMSELLDAVLAALTAEADGEAVLPQGLIVLALSDLQVDASMSSWRAPRNVLLELGQHDLLDERRLRQIFEIQKQGVRIALRLDEPVAPPPDRLPFFQTVVVGSLAGLPPAIDPRNVAMWTLQSATHEQVRGAFGAGMQAVCGWPTVPEPGQQPAGLTPAQSAVFELMRLVQADAEVRHLEGVFKAEPLLAYLLLTLANSPAFRRPTPVSSIGQAIALLGYRRLTRWLVLLLAIAGKNAHSAPLIFTAVARGHFLENIAAAAGRNRAERDEAFVLGMFSLLEAITGQPLQDLLHGTHLAASLGAALLERAGPYAPLLELAQSREAGADPRSEPVPAWPVDAGEINRALLRALAAADSLQYLIR